MFLRLRWAWSEGSPYSLLGADGVAQVSEFIRRQILPAPEVSKSFRIFEELSDARCIWATIGDTHWAVAGIYGPPGGDVEFWREVLRKRRLVMSRGAMRTLLVGDMNIHLTGLVEHESTCKCAHCDPRG